MTRDYLNILTQELILELDRRFKLTSSFDISLVADEIDHQIMQFTVFRLWTDTKQIILNSESSSDFVHEYVKIDHNAYLIHVQQPMFEPDCLEIGYINLNAPKNKPSAGVEETIKLNQVGRFKRVNILLPDHAKVDVDAIRNLLTTIFNVGYNWLWRTIRRNISDHYIVNGSLYKRIKLALSHEPDASKSIWFVVQHKDTCHLLIENENVEYALRKLDATSAHPYLSSYNLLDEFINMRLPYDKAFASEACRTGKCIDGVINISKYAENLPLLANSQQNVFSNNVSVYPVITEGKHHLFASFPTEFRPVIEPVLDLNREQIKNDFDQMCSRWHKVLRKLNINSATENSAVDRLVNLSGNFLGAIFNSLLKG